MQFTTVPRLFCRPGARHQVGDLLGNLISHSNSAAKSIVVVTDPGVRRLGLTEDVEKCIRKLNIEAHVFDGVSEDPSENVILELTKFMLERNCAAVVGVGGGSSLDAAKLGSYLGGGSSQSLAECYGVGNITGKRLPLIQIPTTAGTGSEVTGISIVTTGESEKKGIVSAELYADCVILDGELTLSVPPKVTAATGIDAMVHAVEAITSKFLKNPLSNVLALESLRLLEKNIRTVVKNGNDAQARSDMLLGSCFAGMAFANAPVGGVHALAYPIGSHFHVPHGLSNSLVLPHVLRFNGNEPYEKLAHLFPHQSSLGDGFARLAEELELPTTLREVGITENDLELLSTEAMKQTRILPNNPKTINLEDARAIYESAF